MTVTIAYLCIQTRNSVSAATSPLPCHTCGLPPLNGLAQEISALFLWYWCYTNHWRICVHITQYITHLYNLKVVLLQAVLVYFCHQNTSIHCLSLAYPISKLFQIVRHMNVRGAVGFLMHAVFLNLNENHAWYISYPYKICSVAAAVLSPSPELETGRYSMTQVTR